MYGLVSLLDDHHHALVERLWAEMAQRFGAQDETGTAVPHFSYHVAEQYAMGRVEAILEETAKETAVFTIQATGIGIFPGSPPIIYIPIARNPALTRLHKQLWPTMETFSQDSVAYYAPDVWLPHITLAYRSITQENMAPVVQWLHAQTINWTLTVNNVTLLSDGNGRHEQHRQYSFSQ